MKQLFTWRKVGRSWVANIGSLMLVVDERGSVQRGLRWRVRDVLGALNFGSGWRKSLDAAILEAEAIAVREALPSLRKIVAARKRAHR